MNIIALDDIFDAFILQNKSQLKMEMAIEAGYHVFSIMVVSVILLMWR